MNDDTQIQSTSKSHSASVPPPPPSRPPPPPPTAFRSRNHPPSHPENPAPTPPPRSPLPALPSASSPLTVDMETSGPPILNLVGRSTTTSSSSARVSWAPSPQKQMPFDVKPGWFDPETGSLSDRTVSDAFLLDALMGPNTHQTLDHWHNNQFKPTIGGMRVTDSELGHPATGTTSRPPSDTFSSASHVTSILAAYSAMPSGSSSRPRSRASVASASTTGRRRSKKDRRVSPPSFQRTHTAPASPRASIASDLLSLSETSKALNDLSKRLSGSFQLPQLPVVDARRESIDAFDPFEFDRFQDKQPSTLGRSARSSPAANDHSNRSSIASTSQHQHHLTITASSPPPPSSPTEQPILSPTLRSALSRSIRSTGPPASQDLLQKSQDLADKRANLEARRAALLGLSLPPKPLESETPPPPSAQFPPSLKTKGSKPPKLLLRPDTAESINSVSSAATARPGIILRPSTDGSASPSQTEFDASTVGARTPGADTTRFRSPSSMTFGGDCHNRPPPPVPSKRFSDAAPPVPSKHDSIPPPLPPKDGPPTPLASTFATAPPISPDLESILANKTAERSRSRSRPRDSITTTESSLSSASSRPVKRTPPEVANRRLSTMSSINSLRNPSRNFSLPSDVYAEETEEEDVDDDAGINYFSHAEARAMEWSPKTGGLIRTSLESCVEALQEDEYHSDSSLDLHTPLPDILVRAGVLSSRSALLASTSGNDAEQKAKSKQEKVAELARGVGGKVISKDRLVRHRDGKTLGLGLGLTTGLGWSDSEDEGAPSPLRRHISQIILNKKTSSGSFSTLASSASSSRRESNVSQTTASSGPSRRSSSKGSGSTHTGSTVSGHGSSQLSKLRTTNLRGSQSMAQIHQPATRPPLATRQASMSIPGYGGPPSSYSSRFSKSTTQSQQSSISSIGSILQPPMPPIPSPASRSPASSSTSLSTASSSFSPITPGGSPAGDSTVTFNSDAVGTDDSIATTEKPVRPEVRRTASSSAASTPTATLSGKATPRSRAASHAMPPPSSFAKSAAVSSPTSSASGVPVPRARTNSSGSASAIPAPASRARTTSTSSVATNTTSALKSKSSMASIRSVARSINSETAPALPSLAAPPSKSVMTVGTLAFPSPPPLSPHILSMRMAQAQAQADLRKSNLSRATTIASRK
ncbi:hypothetical protein FRC04_009808 [Tulasnella sp. 424]|nr:hypothetical protein FRC04_009808 [Tulasnella sp. 424]KAG8971176.1 hypothetical protein FRC05_011460 [Tulasnella sp. 425]